MVRCLFIAALVSASGLQTARADSDGNRGQLSMRDFKFATDAAQGGQMEVTLGQLAAQKANDPGVRDFGQRMVTDHQKANTELKQIITQKGATLPTDASKEEKMVEYLRTLSGMEFDKAYVKHMAKDHKKDVKEFQKQAEKGDDADLKGFAAKTLPILQEHLRLVENLDTTINGAKAQAKN